jgi:hypothetical protein
MTTTVGDLISGLLDVYERRYDDHELAAVKTALVVDELLRAHGRRDQPESTETARSERSRSSMRGSARKAA